MQLPVILEYAQSLGHKVFTTGLYDMNIIGVRTRDDHSNAFNDWMCVVYKDEDGWVERWWPITTDPGMYWRENPMKVAGTAIMKPGQYRGAYMFGYHPNPGHERRYEALVQIGGSVTVYRDDDKNETLDMRPGTEVSGWLGINIHMAGKQSASTEVNKWSAGCQVFADPDDFAAFLAVCKRQLEHHPTWTKFTYTLVDEPEFELRS